MRQAKPQTHVYDMKKTHLKMDFVYYKLASTVFQDISDFFQVNTKFHPSKLGTGLHILAHPAP
jgi:hypothetical protein